MAVVLAQKPAKNFLASGPTSHRYHVNVLFSDIGEGGVSRAENWSLVVQQNGNP